MSILYLGGFESYTTEDLKEQWPVNEELEALLIKAGTRIRETEFAYFVESNLENLTQEERERLICLQNSCH